MVPNYLVCEADFPNECVWPDPKKEPIPAGKELAEFLKGILQGRADNITDVWNEEDFGWSFNCGWNKVRLNVLVQRPGDHWLIICNVIRLLPRFLRSRRCDSALAEFCGHLGIALQADGRFWNLKWVTSKEYDATQRSNRK